LRKSWQFDGMTSPIAVDLNGFIAYLPKTETHLHIEGALPFRLLQSLHPERFPEVPEFWQRSYRYETFARFEEILIEHALLWYTSPERYHEAAKVIFQGLVEQNCRYVETSFHLGILGFLDGVSGLEIVRAIKAAAPAGLEVKVFAGMLRNQYAPPLDSIIEELHLWDELDGIDLHGQEAIPLEPWTAEIWRRNQRAGKTTKAHAGEFGGAGNVRQAIEELGVRRIQHGVRAIEDPAVMELARERGVAFDICPISNVKLGVVPSMAAHPIRDLIKAGVTCTISTDDPFSFGNRLVDEYSALATELGFSATELAGLARNGFEVAALSPEVKRQCLQEIDLALANVSTVIV
jgi:adenosine deaminase